MDFILNGLFKAFELLINFDPETFSAIYATVRASIISMTVSLIIGLPIGFFIGFFSFPCKVQIRTIVDTLQALPTVLIGLLVYAFLTRRGPLGHMGLLFTVQGIAIGQSILALPIVIALTASAVESMDQNLSITLISLGANRRQVFLSTLWETRFGILAAFVNAYGRVLTEVGISMMVGGNIKWQTRTITTAIALETNKGEFACGISLGLVLLFIAFTVNFILSFLRNKT